MPLKKYLRIVKPCEKSFLKDKSDNDANHSVILSLSIKSNSTDDSDHTEMIIKDYVWPLIHSCDSVPFLYTGKACDAADDYGMGRHS
jgi:hypothetical protein